MAGADCQREAIMKALVPLDHLKCFDRVDRGMNEVIKDNCQGDAVSELVLEAILSRMNSSSSVQWTLVTVLRNIMEPGASRPRPLRGGWPVSCKACLERKREQ